MADVNGKIRYGLKTFCDVVSHLFTLVSLVFAMGGVVLLTICFWLSEFLENISRWYVKSPSLNDLRQSVTKFKDDMAVRMSRSANKARTRAEAIINEQTGEKDGKNESEHVEA